MRQPPYATQSKPIIEAIEARWGKDVWERHRKRPLVD